MVKLNKPYTLVAVILISEDQEYQALKEKKVCVDRRKTCSMPLETQIYLLKKQTVCVACSSVLSPEILSKFEEVKTEFSTVLPNCGVEACLKFMEFWLKGPNKGWICKRPRKQNKKNKI